MDGRLRFSCIAALFTVLLVAGCGGDDGSKDSSGGLDESQYQLTVAQCDGIRASGTVKNLTGATTAFEVTASFTYSAGGEGVPIQSATTAAVGDGETADFSISPDVAGAVPPDGCDVTSVHKAPGG
jgi:hypothetical protein